MKKPRGLIRILVGLLIFSILIWGLFNFVSVQAAPSLSTSDIHRVDTDNVSGTYNGDSWATAYQTLQDALAVAGSGDEIWVAEGVYYPDEGSGQTNNSTASTFTVKDEVGIYGGFKGTETARHQRNWKNNTTVLSGDIDKNDTKTDGITMDWADINGTNAEHILTSVSLSDSAVLDGFTITGGYTSSYGAGLYNQSSDTTLQNLIFIGNYGNGGAGAIEIREGSVPRIVYSEFIKNYGGNYGGAITVWSSTANLEEVVLLENTAGLGGGIYNDGSDISITDSVFESNSATQGGGLCNYSGSSASISSSTFYDNSATTEGGGIYNYYGGLTISHSNITSNTATSNGGGLYTEISNTTPQGIISYTTFDNNSASNGGAIYKYGGTVISNLYLTNCTISSNSATLGGGIYNKTAGHTYLAVIHLNHCTIYSNTATTSGGGIYVSTPSNPTRTTVYFTNSIIANQTQGADCAKDTYANMESSGYNIDSDNTCNLTLGSDHPNATITLGPLQDNGGPTETHALPLGSLAIDDIPNATNGCGTIYKNDQRGHMRPKPPGGKCDIGAYEFGYINFFPLIFK